MPGDAAREEGFYWVSWMHEWIVAEWDGMGWDLPGRDIGVSDILLDKIDERRLVRPT